MRTLAVAALAACLTAACAEDPALLAYDRAAAMGLAVERPSGPCVRTKESPHLWSRRRVTEVRC